MTPRTICLLHVEDDHAFRQLVAYHLSTMDDLRFDIVGVDNENEAIEVFGQQTIDFVIVDYQLTKGDGLGCVRRLRDLDPAVPIVAVSGVATTEIAAELIAAGADDFIRKPELTREGLIRSVRESLARSDVWRRRTQSTTAELTTTVSTIFEELCRDFATGAGPAVLGRLDELETAARKAGATAAAIHQLFTRVCDQLDRESNRKTTSARRTLRPIMLDLLLRLFAQDRAT